MAESFKLPYFNNTDYPLAVKNQLAQLDYNVEEAEKLRLNQFISTQYYTRASHIRGMLLAWGMGQGKTRGAIAIAEYFRNFEPRRKVILLLPKSLEANFRSNIKAYTGHTSDEYADKNYTFLSLNASNMFKQVSNARKSKEEIQYENRLGEFMNDVIKKNSLDNSLLIIDEAHNLFNAITNGAKNAVGLYDLIMKATNLKLLFLTGTPIINDPFELIPCFNMLRGPMPINSANININDTHKTTLLFSESREEFENYFVDRKNKTIKNKVKFANRIYGLTSYYGEVYFSDKDGKPGFPKKLPTIVEKIPMSYDQFAVYTSARIIEQEETKKSYKNKNARFSSSTGGNSSYRVKSRQISNYAIPEYALGPARGAKAREKFIGKITFKDLQNTQKFSPKMQKIIMNINKFQKKLGMVYSQFVSGEGLGVFARVLEAHGYVNINNAFQADENNGFDIKTKPQPKFAILSGEIPPEVRANIITRFNNPKNSGGSDIQLLLLSGAMAEGIDLKRIRHVHIMEPFWNYARINQVETRAIRFESHIDLPPAEQNVQVFIYLSTYPSNYPKEKIIEKTTDVELYDKSMNNMRIINSFLTTIAEASIDCNTHYDSLSDDIKEKIKCKLCAPNHMPLFHPLLTKDMELPSNCSPYTESKISVHEIVIPESNETFYYKIDKDDTDNKRVSIYVFNKKINGYTPMPRNHRYYGHLMEEILNK